MLKPLEELPDEIVPHVNFLVEEASREQKAARLGNLCNEISRHERALGICLLLVEAEVDGFFHWLIQSALTRRHYLERCARDALAGDRHQRASFADPFFDAVAASQWGLARQIAALSPTEWMPGAEYEDDFAYARFLHLLAEPATDALALGPVLDRYERALEGGADVRLDLSRALLDRDQQGFDGAFAALVGERKRKLDELANPDLDSILAQDYAFEPNRHVFVEGLALLRLAEARGLVTEVEYLTCPSEARRTAYAPFEPLAFPDTRP